MKNKLFFKKVFSIFLHCTRTLSSEYSFLVSIYQFLKSLQEYSSYISIRGERKNQTTEKTKTQLTERTEPQKKQENQLKKL